MIDINYFKSVRILDGGMGQELLSKGLQSKGSLWSASALLEEKYHQLVIDAHLSFINAGANVIVTNNLSARRTRMIENKVKDKQRFNDFETEYFKSLKPNSEELKQFKLIQEGKDFDGKPLSYEQTELPNQFSPDETRRILNQTQPIKQPDIPEVEPEPGP